MAFPIRSWWWATVPAIALFLLQTRRINSLLTAAAAGLAFGGAFFGLLIPWLAELGVIAFIPPLVVLSFFPAVYAVFMARSAELSSYRWFVRAVGGWALMEWIRVRWPLGGLGWGMAGYPLSEWSPPRAAARWIGASGWTVLVAAAAAALALLGRPNRTRNAESLRLAGRGGRSGGDTAGRRPTVASPNRRGGGAGGGGAGEQSLSGRALSQ